MAAECLVKLMIIGLISTITLFTLIHPVLAAAQSPLDKHERIIGTVKSIRVEEEYSSSLNKDRAQPRRLARLYRFDRRGRNIGVITYDRTGKQLWRWAQYFDPRGRRDTFNTYDEKDRITDRIITFYDRRGRKLRSVYTIGEPSPSVTRYRDNVKNQLIREIHYNPDGSTCFSRIYGYDENGNKNYETQQSGAPSRRSMAKGCPIIIHHGADTWAYLYDRDGNLLEWKFYAEQKVFLSKDVYRYDERGNVTLEVNEDREGVPYGRCEYTYEFDSVGNWTKRTPAPLFSTRRLPDAQAKVIYRSITYYD